MNILYSGDENIIDGLLISILSLLKNTDRVLNIYVLTMKYETEEKSYNAMPESYIKYLDKLIKKKNKKNFIELHDITKEVNKYMPTANVNTRFTPYCMLRLYADLLDFMPEKILYLDNDIVFLKNPDELYDLDIDKYQLAGVLDYYGSKVLRRGIKKDYLNSGVLLLNMSRIKKSKLFEKARKMCKYLKMLMPDQTALNHYCRKRKIIDRKYNEQHEIKDDTVIRHFTTTFKVWPEIKTQTIKPWNIEELHNTLKCHEFDDVLDDYKKIIKDIKK